MFDIASAFVDMENIEFLPGIMFAYKIEELEPPNRKVEDMEIVHGLANTEHSLVVESRFDLATSIELVKWDALPDVNAKITSVVDAELAELLAKIDIP